MKRIFVFLILISSGNVFAQQRINDKQIELISKYAKDNKLLSDDVDFTASADTKWENESAVILCQKTQFNFDKKGLSVGKRIGRNLLGAFLALPTMGASMYFANAKNETKILVEESERRKILLRDKFAIAQYSILYFRFHSEGDAFAARVIKKDGTNQPVSLEDAVKVEDVKSVPGVFRSYTDGRLSAYYRPVFFKVAIPDLEEGDIIEYEFKNYNTQEYSHNPNYKEFEPVYYICNRELPVSKQIIEVVTEDEKYFIGYKSLKGAPDFSQTGTTGKKVYRWVDNNRDKLTDTRFVNEFVEQPSLKFQVIYARNSSKGFVWFSNEGEMKKEMTAEQLSAKVKTFWFNSSKLQATGDYTEGLRGSIDNSVSSIYKILKKRGIAEDTEDDYVRKIYYTLRGSTMYSNWSDFAFAKVFSGLLEKRKIDHEIIVSTSNLRTQLGNVAFTQEVAWLIKYKGKFYCNPNEHLNPEEVPVYLSGNACVRFNYNDEKSAVRDVIPVSDTSANTIATLINAALTPDNINMVVNKTVEVNGLVKDDVIDDVLIYTPFMESDYRNYDGTGMFEQLSERDMETAREEFNKEKKEWKEEKPKVMKELAENEYGVKVEKYGNFKLTSDGRSYKKKAIKYTEDFTVSEMTAVAGNDIVISLPAFIGSHSRITTEERKRSLPIDVRYARKLSWHIVMPVPAGYSVKGLESLNRNVNNGCGNFSSTAIVEGGSLVIDVKKIYKNGHFEAAQWSDMVAVLDAAYNFSQAKLVLKKD